MQKSIFSIWAALIVFCLSSLAYCSNFVQSTKPLTDTIVVVKQSVGEDDATVPFGMLAAITSTWIKTGVLIPLEVFKKQIEWESGFDPGAQHYNPDGSIDYGLGQLNSRSLPSFMRSYNDGKTFDPFDVKENLKISARYLSDMFKETGTWQNAIAAYNLGLWTFDQLKKTGQTLPASTRRYLDYVFGG